MYPMDHLVGARFIGSFVVKQLTMVLQRLRAVKKPCDDVQS